MAKQTVTRSAGPSDKEHDTPAVLDDALRREIELRAYDRHCQRGCGLGSDVEDWLWAEKEVLEERQRNAAPRHPGVG